MLPIHELFDKHRLAINYAQDNITPIHSHRQGPTSTPPPAPHGKELPPLPPPSRSPGALRHPPHYRTIQVRWRHHPCLQHSTRRSIQPGSADAQPPAICNPPFCHACTPSSAQVPRRTRHKTGPAQRQSMDAQERARLQSRLCALACHPPSDSPTLRRPTPTLTTPRCASGRPTRWALPLGSVADASCTSLAL